MAHTRTLVREHLARELVNRGAWQDSIYVDRATPLDDQDHWPNVCIFTQSERTTERKGNGSWMQGLSVLIEVRERRQPDMDNAWSRNIAGMPNHAAQTASASRLLDDACEAIEQIVIQTFSRSRVVVEGKQLSFDAISEINTDITRDVTGEIPYVLAQIEFKLNYERCVDPLPPESCPLEHVLGEIRFKTCSVGDKPVETRNDMPQDESIVC